MSRWKWLENPAQRPTWGFGLRVILKAAALFALLNVLFALLDPMGAVGRLSIYNTLVPGRERLPYGENPAESYNLSLSTIPAMFAAHEVAAPPADDEFRVLLLGDSATWGWLLESDATTSAVLNALDIQTSRGLRVVAYNVGYPVLSLTKDLLLLEAALDYQPDLIVWLVTLASFAPEAQLRPVLVQENAERLRDLIAAYDLDLDPDDERLVERDFWGQTLVGQRRPLADWLRLQVYGLAWASTGIDQAFRDYEPLSTDFGPETAWEGFTDPDAPGGTGISREALAFDVLDAGVRMAWARGVSVMVVNEPVFIAEQAAPEGENTTLHYNAWYPRWVYDAYRELLAEAAQDGGWTLRDLWDVVPPQFFTDSPVHFTPEGARLIAQQLASAIQAFAEPAFSG